MPDSTTSGRILVVGGTGELGAMIARKLLAAGRQVRVFGRNVEKLDALATQGAEVFSGTLLDLDAITRACLDVAQIITTANNVRGHGATSPNRVDLPAHRNLCAAAKQHHVQRLVYVSGLGMEATSPVDFFRLKHHIEVLVRQSGVPYVLLRPSAFMDLWVGTMIGEPILAGKAVVLFGDGARVGNMIATDVVAQFAVRVLERDDVRNEVVEIGGPSNLSSNDVVTLVERALGVTAKRKRIPVAVLRIGSTLLRPFNEVASRMMSMGYFTATHDTSFADWRIAADRFGVAPVSVEAFIAQRFSTAFQNFRPSKSSES